MGKTGQDVEQRGIEFVTRNEEKFIGVLEKINASVERVSATIEAKMGKAAEKSSQSVDKMSKSAEKLDKAFGGNLIAKLGNFGQGLANIPGVAGKVGAALSGLPAIFEAMASPATAAAAGVIALTAAIFALGGRGATFVGIEQSFQNLAAGAGLAADAFLNRLKTAAASTISELELMRQTNIALAGATGQFRTEFAESLPRLLEIARVQARATGQSVEFLFQSLVTGIKRSSPLLIDNTGLVLKVGEATESYARSVGKTVEELTAAERQISILNATLQAGTVAIDAAGGIQEGAAEKFARIQARITNILDKLGVAVQPLYELILDTIDFFVSKTEEGVNFIAPILQFGLQLVANFARFWAGLWSSILAPVFQVFGWIFQVIIDAGAKFLLGAASMMGAFANGLIEGYNRYVFPVLLEIVTGLADFLVGQSPPPKGPLSKIDEGGANTMQAWIDGFAGVSMQPVEQAAAFVSQAMGSVATASLDAVNKRLAQLDKSIQPFVNQLEIAKARFEAIQEPAEAALRAIDRQLDKAVEALNRGEAGSDEIVRSLDARREALLNYMDAQQASADEAQFHLLLAKSQQAEERALLGIRKKQLEASQKVGTKAKKVAAQGQKAAAGEKEKKGKGEASLTEPIVDTAITAPPTPPGMAEGPSFLDQLGSAFSDQLEFGNMLEFGRNNDLLGDQIERLQGANFGERIGGFFSGVGEQVETNLVQPIREKIDDVINFFTGTGEGTLSWGLSSPENMMSLASQLMALPFSINTWLMELPVSLGDYLGFPFTSIKDQVVATLFGDGPESLKSRMFNWFAGTGDGTLSAIVTSGVAIFMSLPLRIAQALQPIGLTVWNTIAVPIIETLNTVIDQINQFIQNNADFGNLVAAALGVQGLDFNSVRVPRLETTPPAFLTSVPQAAKGGIFGKGILSVGERGQEYIANASSKMAVFPNQFVRAMEGLNKSINGQSVTPVYGTGSGDTNTSYSKTQNNTMNFVRDPQDMMQRMAILKAYGMGGSS